MQHQDCALPLREISILDRQFEIIWLAKRTFWGDLHRLAVLDEHEGVVPGVRRHVFGQKDHVIRVEPPMRQQQRNARLFARRYYQFGSRIGKDHVEHSYKNEVRTRGQF